MPNISCNDIRVKQINNVTVREFAALLAALPEELQNRTFSCSGYTSFYLHNRPLEGVLTVDEEEYID